MGLQDLLQAGQPMRNRITEVLEAEANANQDINRNWVHQAHAEFRGPGDASRAENTFGRST